MLALRCHCVFGVSIFSITTLCGSALAQPQRLYAWPGTTPFNGQYVLDASYGGGAEAYAWGVVIHTDGVLDGWGDNRWGQLGYAPPQPTAPCIATSSSCKLPYVGDPAYTPRVRKVGAGYDHNLGLSDDPNLVNQHGLIGWGRADRHQCEVPMWDAAGNPKHPWDGDHAIPASAKVVKISVGEFINIVLFDN
jgi:hypothetical protein